MGKLMELAGRQFGLWKVICRGNNSRWGQAMWICECACGKKMLMPGSDLVRGRSRGCRPCATTRERNSHWKGGRSVTPQGYVLVLDPTHPNAQKDGYVREHIQVITRHLGRPLTQKETTHHIDGDRQNNTIENLQLWSSNHPSGQRVSDLVAYAKELLREYEPTALAPPLTPVFGHLRTSP